MSEDFHLTIDSLDDAIESQRDLVAQVKALNVGQRRLRIISVLVAVVAVLSAVGVVVAVQASRDAEDAADDVAAAAVQQQADREEVRLTTCQSRNAAYRATRDDISTVLFALAEASENPVTAQALAEELVGLLSKPEAVNTDCDQDGNAVGPGDYPGPSS